MSPLTQSLENRIQELRASIDAQTTELAAYEKVLELESGKIPAAAETPAATEKKPMKRRGRRPKNYVAPVEEIPTPAEEPKEVEASSATTEPVYAGNKTDFVGAVVKLAGKAGATPKEIDETFEKHGVPRSKNLVYNALGFYLKRKKMTRKDGRYYSAELSVASAKGPKKGVKTRRRISPEGLKRIRDANKKRWAARRAALGK